MKPILMLVLALTVSGCEIIGAVSIISDVASVMKPDPIVSDYEVAFGEAQKFCSQEGKKAKLRRGTMRTITSYTTADFDCVSLSSDIKTSGNVSNLPAPPNYK